MKMIFRLSPAQHNRAMEVWNNGNFSPLLQIFLMNDKLIVHGERKTISDKNVVGKISFILGRTWKVTKPDMEGDDKRSFYLYWYENEQQYYNSRASWDDFYSWVINHEDQIYSFPAHFKEANECSRLIKLGKHGLYEARKKHGKLADQVYVLLGAPYDDE